MITNKKELRKQLRIRLAADLTSRNLDGGLARQIIHKLYKCPKGKLLLDVFTEDYNYNRLIQAISKPEFKRLLLR